MAYEDIQNVQRHRRKEDAVSEQDDMGYVGESRIPWSDVEGAPKMPKPLPSSRELTERIVQKCLYTGGGFNLSSCIELTDAYVAVRVAEERLKQHNRDCLHEIGGHCSEYVQLESALSAACERWQKIGQ